CHSDGLWGLYGEAAVNATQPRMRFVCQPRHLNPLICGRKPRYRRTEATQYVHEFFAPRNLSPWLLGLKKRGRYECSATLISDSWLLTAAHCVASSLESQNETMDPSDLKVQLAPNPRDDRYVAKIILHPDYEPAQPPLNIPLNDLALVMLEEPLIFSERMYPACIDLDGENFITDSIARAFSRANGVPRYEYDEVLQELDPDCHGPVPRCRSWHIEDTQFCGLALEENKKLVGGSSGGPYMQNLTPDAEESWAMSGVVSAILNRANCDQPLTIYTVVYPFKEWIENVVEGGQ
ncbi:brain-specific serine protease 4-like, partial [Hyalella azteca]|uniref:Brain-specific serine protease 4-like n=1 Tax=Hyalella azteca TaxID=294128 RepID=A0A8B7NBB5_HYAAZ